MATVKPANRFFPFGGPIMLYSLTAAALLAVAEVPALPPLAPADPQEEKLRRLFEEQLRRTMEQADLEEKLRRLQEPLRQMREQYRELRELLKQLEEKRKRHPPTYYDSPVRLPPGLC
jgi:predicted nuclease with TOPRIM domain